VGGYFDESPQEPNVKIRIELENYVYVIPEFIPDIPTTPVGCGPWVKDMRPPQEWAEVYLPIPDWHSGDRNFANLVILPGTLVSVEFFYTEVIDQWSITTPYGKLNAATVRQYYLVTVRALIFDQCGNHAWVYEQHVFYYDFTADAGIAISLPPPPPPQVEHPPWQIELDEEDEGGETDEIPGSGIELPEPEVKLKTIWCWGYRWHARNQQKSRHCLRRTHIDDLRLRLEALANQGCVVSYVIPVKPTETLPWGGPVSCPAGGWSSNNPYYDKYRVEVVIVDDPSCYNVCR
jgi:hypothetical protein